MNYIAYAVLGLVSYTLVAPLTKLATQDLSSDVVAAVTNGMLVVAAIAVVVLSADKSLTEAFTHPDAKYMVAAGVCLAVGILAYYRALAAGPVSVVVPIFGMFLVTSSAVGILALDEPLTAKKAVGILLAGVAVYLTAS
ncbi:EamA family transporter [Natronomonas sp. EA1]|uniref:EamA family transporter n=1 Tax=Natronomonas sp. EA1 TaxID=3421655 RepID=UPI003EC0584F